MRVDDYSVTKVSRETAAARNRAALSDAAVKTGESSSKGTCIRAMNRSRKDFLDSVAG